MVVDAVETAMVVVEAEDVKVVVAKKVAAATKTKDLFRLSSLLTK